MNKPTIRTKPDAPEMPQKSPREGNFKLLSIFKAKVPADYNPDTSLADFKVRHQGEFAFYQNNINDENFPQATDRLEVGKTYVFQVFEPERKYRSAEALQFCRSIHALLVGIQGYVLGWPGLRYLVPEGKTLVSFDQAEMLYIVDGRSRIAQIENRRGGTLRFFIGHFATDWARKDLLLCVIKKPD